MEATLPGPGPQWRPSAVVFDCDGVLMDTERAWKDVQARVAGTFGVEIPERTAIELMGLSATDVAEHIAARAQDTAGRDGRSAPGFETVYRSLVDTEADVVGSVLEPLPGAVETVKAVARHVPVAVASNSTSTILDRKMHAVGLADTLRTWVSAEDVPRGKPAPDIYREAVRRLGVAPEDALAVEDSPAGTTAAVAAGLWVLGAPHGHDEPLASHYLVGSLADPAVAELLRGWDMPL
ncbi:HAD family hydrolase [Kocuria tytonis]|uniref:HAD family phosphatase n=1 Tax=Kocuria tytonis TaxID=2054280 RepID=A0A495A518_9MICC|nr:HAD family phosphatase [Kocuria tytonis]RKQ34868.1 HAD family phosphatase [Kocuria tytonis]